MSEDTQVEEQVVETTPEGAEQVQEPQYTEIEQRALDMGWRPKDNFEGSEDDFIDAKEFVRRKPLFEKIDHQNRQIKAVTKALDEFKNHYTKVRENEFNRALNQLKEARKQAMTEGDGERFTAIDDQIKVVEQEVKVLQHEQTKPAVQEEVVHPEFQSWKSRNPWYESTGYMRKFADDAGAQYHKSGMSPPEVLAAVEKAVRKEFPQKFVNPNKANAPLVESSSPTGGAKGKKDGFELNEQERKVMNDLVRTKVLTKEEYISDLRRLKGLA
jgi:hypothetical protein